jgi:hypothetical protein
MRLETVPASELRAGDIVALRVDQVLANYTAGKVELSGVEHGPLLPEQECWRVRPAPVRVPYPSTEAILRFFDYEHLPAQLQGVSRPFSELAHDMAANGAGAELTAGLRKLLEAKDCMVRAAIMRELQENR